MSTTITPAFERLCDEQFELARVEAYTGLDLEIAAIKQRHNALGPYVSSATGEAVKYAVLVRFDRVVAAFDRTYLGKWRDNPARLLTDEDANWLNMKAGFHLNAAANEAEAKCNTYLGEPRTFFAEYWCGTGIEARQRSAKVQKQIEILKLQTSQSTTSAWPKLTANDYKFAQMAVEEAKKSLEEDDGRTHPKVGAVVVMGDQVLASAHRGEIPGCHAEYIALERKLADRSVAGATIYTTLEPCTERNPPKVPCAHRLVERKVKRVVIGTLDPNPEIRGCGQLILRDANIITDFFPHDLMSQVEELNRQFARLHRTTTANRIKDVASSRDLVSEQRYFEERRDLVDTVIIKRLWAKPRWRFLICPTKFMEAQFPDLSQCTHFIQQNAVRSRSWDYPCPSTEHDPLGQWIAGELDIPESPHLERWVLFRSGQFVHNRALPEIPALGNKIHYLEILRVVQQAFEFATKMARAGVLSPEGIVRVELKKVGGRGLLVPESFEPGSPSYWSKEGDISFEKQITPHDLETRSRDMSLDYVIEIYKRFGWKNAKRSQLARE